MFAGDMFAGNLTLLFCCSNFTKVVSEKFIFAASCCMTSSGGYASKRQTAAEFPPKPDVVNASTTKKV
jgi:hypothetical protein